jgi:tetratricopeptide (TPR) repeat protein
LVERAAGGRDAPACVELAERFQRRGQVTAAIRELEKAVAWQPGLAEAHKQLGFCLAQVRDHPRAVAHLQRATALDPADWDGFAYLGTIYQHTGRYLDGARAFERASALNPRLADAHFHAGECYLAATLLDPATAAFRRALALQPENHTALFLLGQAYWWQGRLEEARREVAEAARLQPRNAKYLRTLGFIDADLPDTEANRRAAMEHLERAVALDPRAGTARYKLGTLYRRAGRWREAVAAWEAAAALQPARSELRIELGRGYQRLGRKREAAEQFARFRRLQAAEMHEKTLGYLRRETLVRPDDADARYRLGVFYQEQMRDPRRAAEQFQEALRLAPGHARARERLTRRER